MSLRLFPIACVADDVTLVRVLRGGRVTVGHPDRAARFVLLGPRFQPWGGGDGSWGSYLVLLASLESDAVGATFCVNDKCMDKPTPE